MAFERSSLRYAHSTGYTSLTYVQNSSEYIISCGSDGDLRKWKGFDDDDPTSCCLGEFIMCIVEHDGRLLASTDRNSVQAYTFPGIENDGVVMRFTAPVTCLSANKQYIVAGSEDTNIKVKKCNANGDADLLFKHAGPVLALDICPTAPYLASCGGDGCLKIWNLDTGAELQSFDGLPKTNSFEGALQFGTPTFEPCQGKVMAYVKNKEVCVVNTSTWELQFTLFDERITGSYTCCRFSSDGQYLAAGTTSGELSVFDILRKQPLKCEPAPTECMAITCLAWKPKSDKEVAYCDAAGQLGILFSSSAATVASTATSVKDDAGLDFGDIQFEEDDDEVRSEHGENFENHQAAEADDDDDNGISIEKLKSDVMKSVGGTNFDDEDSRDSAHSKVTSVVAKTFKQQPAFQPSSTPCKLEHRYLVWNNVGIVTAHADNSDGSIDVEFHDASVHHALHIPNFNGHDMASLSSSVLALAATDSTKLVCIALTAAGNKEWSVQLPDCESVEALAVSVNFVAVATSSSFLRIFTVMGTQREIITIPGPIVAMAGYEDRIIVVYHSASPSANQQFVAAMLLQTNGLSLRCQHLPLPLTPGRQLTWLGFSDCGSPVFSDSMGLVQLMSLKSNCWLPICDTLKQSQSVSNNYFIISVLERQQIIQAVLCRGCAYPMTNPRPMMQELTMQMPHCDIETDKSGLEDTLVRASFMLMENSEKTIKETAIKLFALACRSENEARAKELIETIGSAELLQLAMKYATKLGRTRLAERLYDIMPQIQQEKDNEYSINQAIPISPYKSSQQYGEVHNSGGSNVKLAPKAMELKRASLKRYSMSSFNSNKRMTESVELSGSANNTETEIDSQENIYTERTGETESQDTKQSTRSPFNSVNPFAAKRKLADADLGQKESILYKLKIAKK